MECASILVVRLLNVLRHGGFGVLWNVLLSQGDGGMGWYGMCFRLSV